MLNALATIATSVGLSSALILFFVWQAWKREERMAKRVEALEDFSRSTLIDLTKETTGALLKDAEATQACSKVVEANTQAILANLERSKNVEALLVDHHEFAVEMARRLEVEKGK